MLESAATLLSTELFTLLVQAIYSAGSLVVYPSSKSTSSETYSFAVLTVELSS
jgi:hypothetical protein